MSLLSVLHDVAINGALQNGGSYGGHACVNHVAWEKTLVEGAFWSTVSVVAFFYCDIPGLWRRLKQRHPLQPVVPTVTSLDWCLAAFHLLMYFYLLYLKTISRTVMVQLQPCHTLLFMQAILLLVKPSTTTRLLVQAHTVWLSGTVMAMVLPDTSNLRGYLEMEVYWVEHIVLTLVTPFRLFERHGAVAHWSWAGLLVGYWSLHAFHWPVMLMLDHLTHVNIEFMLCPTEGMAAVAELLPPYLVEPSYRSFIALTYPFVAVGCGAAYMGLGGLLLRLLHPQPKAKGN